VSVNELPGATCSSAGNGWAVGNTDVALHWDGAMWSTG